MKKKFTFLGAALVLLAFLAIPLGMKGQTRAEESLVALTFPDDNSSSNGLTSNQYGSTWTAMNGDYAWSISNFNNNNWNNNWTYIKCGRKNIASVATITNSAQYSQAITKIELTIDDIIAGSVNSIKLYTSTDNSTWTEVGSFEKSTGTKTVALSSPTSNLYYKIEFDCASGSKNGLVTVSKIEYYYSTGGNLPVVTPSISPDGGSFIGSQEISITCATEGATIYYSTNGNAPTTSSSVYSAPFTITETTTVKAFAVKANYDNSEIATATFTKTTPLTVAEAITATPTSGTSDFVYIQGVVSRFYNTNITGDGTSYRYYISDEGDTNELLVYKGNGLNNVPFSNVNDLLVGDQVVIYGKLTIYQNAPEVAAGNYIYSLERPIVDVEAPTFSIAAGGYAGAQTVEITCETPGVDIFYTTDGSDPDDESTPYSSPITVNETTTIKAIAYSDDNPSAVATADYYILSPTGNNVYTVAEALAFDAYPANNVFVNGIVSTAPTQTPTSNGELTYFISDNGEAENELEVYKGKNLNGTAFTAQGDLQVGDEVTVWGNVVVYTPNNGDPITEFNTGNYLVQYSRPIVPSITFDSATIDLDAEQHDLQIPFTYQNIEVTNYESFSIQFYDANDVETEMPTQWLVIGITETNDGGYQVSGVAIANEGEARSAYFKVYAQDAENNTVYSNRVTITQAAPVIDYATLPFEFNGGKADIENTNGLTHNGLDSDYSANTAPTTKLKFKDTGDWLILHFNEAPGTLTFDIKGNSFSGGTFNVLASVDGETYEDIYEFSAFDGEVQEMEYNVLEEDVRYIKWIYTNKASGNVGLGNIKLEKPTTEPTIIVQDEILVSSDGDEGYVSVSTLNMGEEPELDLVFVAADGETPATYDWFTAIFEDYGITYTVAPNTGDEREAYMKVHGQYNGEDIYSNLVTINQAAAPQQYTLTVEPFENLELITFVNYEMLMEGDSTIYVTEGDSIMLSVVALEGYIMKTLMVNNVNHVNDIADDFTYTFVMPAENVTISATAVELVAPDNYVRITSLDQLTDGCKVIIAARYDEEHTNGYFAMPGVASGKPTGVAFTSETSGNDEILPATITALEDTYYWTVTVTDSAYTFTNANGKMIGYPTSGTDFSNSPNAHTTWTIERSTSAETAMVAEYTGFVISNENTPTRAFAFNGSVFGAYAKTNIEAGGYNFFLDFFVQTENTQTTVTQTIELAEGWNWISTYIEMEGVDGLAMLQESLNGNAEQIKQGVYFTEYDAEWDEWFDSGLTEMSNELMYLVKTITACEVSLEGTVANLSNHSITINPGWNWIGFPSDQSMTVEDAFANFTPESGDKIQYGVTFNEYDAEWDMWFDNGLTQLVPGRGYLYYYNGTTPQTLNFGSAK